MTKEEIDIALQLMLAGAEANGAKLLQQNAAATAQSAFNKIKAMATEEGESDD